MKGNEDLVGARMVLSLSLTRFPLTETGMKFPCSAVLVVLMILLPQDRTGESEVERVQDEREGGGGGRTGGRASA